MRATIALIAENGTRAVTHRAVSARAGLPAASAGYYFPTVSDLIEAALRHYTETRTAALAALFDAVLADADDLLDAASRVAEVLVAAAEPTGVAQYEVYLEASRNPALRDAVQAAVGAFEALCAERLHALGIANPAPAATAFVAVLNGFALNRLATPVPPEQELAILSATLRGLYVAFAATEREMEDFAHRIGERQQQLRALNQIKDW